MKLLNDSDDFQMHSPEASAVTSITVETVTSKIKKRLILSGLSILQQNVLVSHPHKHVDSSMNDSIPPPFSPIMPPVCEFNLSTSTTRRILILTMHFF